MNENQVMAEGLKHLKLIWWALMSSMVCYGLAAPLLFDASSAAADAEYRSTRVVLYMISILSLAASWLLHRIILNARPGPAQPRSQLLRLAIQRYTGAMIISLGLVECIGLYGLILYLFSGKPADFYLLLLLAACAMTLYYPKGEELADLLRKMERPDL